MAAPQGNQSLHHNKSFTYDRTATEVAGESELGHSGADTSSA
jgi:hypothetical protein